MKKILGVGAALVDLVAQVPETWVERHGKAKGGMHMLDWTEMETALTDLASVKEVPGGSACNTLVGLAKLGTPASFLGRVGNDRLGDFFASRIEGSGVGLRLLRCETPTGRVLSAVTPDAQRTMYTFLGASAGILPHELPSDLFADVSLVYIEGYLAFQPQLFEAVVEGAARAGVPVALDLGAFTVVQFCRELLEKTLAAGKIDILIANEDEAQAYTGDANEQESLEQLAKLARIAVVKLGKQGAWIARDRERVRVQAKVVEAIDTTGAGDLWAAGFLHGLLVGWTLSRCGDLASAVAAEVVQVLGTTIPEDGWSRVKAILPDTTY